MILHLAVALVAGGVIGMERSFHGRAAGFRTHALVCLASAALMLVTVYQDMWFRAGPEVRASLDPTRMAQGIMTGIGFLGAGVIMREGHSIRGLTTAASIWTTAVIGILAGIGFFFPAAVTATVTVGVLSAFRWIEARMPTLFNAAHKLRCPRDAIIPEAEVRELITRHGFTIANMAYRLDHARGLFEYSMSIQTINRANVSRLAETLEKTTGIVEFDIEPGE
jgi:putative Mg2+ transporter-C (MgtC) family protein